MSTTPRTDNAWRRYNCAELRDALELVKESSALETELAAACSLQALACRKLDAAETELARLRAELKELSQVYELNKVSIDELDADRARAERAETELAAAKAELARFKDSTWEHDEFNRKNAVARSVERDNDKDELARLRAEVERLKGALALGQENCDAIYNDMRDERTELTARAERAEADTARLDWLEAHALPQHSPSISISDLGRHYNGFPGSFRAAIDAAMKP